MRFKGFIGPSYTLRSVNFDCQRSVNLYPEMNEMGTGKDGEVAALIGTPGLRLAETVGDGPIRCIHVDPDLRVFVVSGDTLYQLTRLEGVWSSSAFATTLSTDTGIVRAASSSLATVFVDGTANYAYVNSGSSFDTFAGHGYSGVATATHVDYIDGYFVFNEDGTNQFWVSDINSLTVDPLDFASAEGNPDDILALIALNRDLWLFNSKTIEVFTNVGDADAPFQRISGGFIEQGCMAAQSVAKIAGHVLWLARDDAGNGSVYMAQGLSPQRVSTHAIEKAFQGYGDISTAKAFTYSANGHYFYVLNFDDATWVYDLSTKLWHERAYLNDGDIERHRAEVHAFVPDLAVHLVGDYEDGNVYQLDDEYYTDNGAYIPRIRTSPHITGDGKLVTYNEFRLDMETGVGVDGGDQGEDPQVMMQFSDDGGSSFSDELWASAGAIGLRKTLVRFRRLGQSRDRVFKVQISDPIKVVLLGAEFDAVQGAS